MLPSNSLISAIISLKEQTKSDNAAKKLKKMITNKMEVIRDDVQNTVDVENIVPGDIVSVIDGASVKCIKKFDFFVFYAIVTSSNKGGMSWLD